MLSSPPPSTSPPPQPLPRAHALFNQHALKDAAIRWDMHGCKSFECLNSRVVGDCKSCFNMTLEANRWRVNYRGALTIQQVVDMKQGSLRLGLDTGRGTGSFAAHMSLHNVTVMTMAMNIETTTGVKKGLPYMETIALRGLVPLHIPHTVGHRQRCSEGLRCSQTVHWRLPSPSGPCSVSVCSAQPYGPHCLVDRPRLGIFYQIFLVRADSRFLVPQQCPSAFPV